MARTLSPSCFGECSRSASTKRAACYACRNNSQLWDPLALVELAVPAEFLARAERVAAEEEETIDPVAEGETATAHAAVEREDVIDPVSVADPQDSEETLLTFRLHQFSSRLHLHYEQRSNEGLLVHLNSAWDHKSLGLHGGTELEHAYTHITVCRARFSLADAKAFPDVDLPLGGFVLLLLAKLPIPGDGANLKLSLMVSRRRLMPPSFLQATRAERLLGAFCDVTICVDGQEFPAHRLVLAAASDVFRTMLTADFRERSEGRIEIKEASARAFAKFLDFLDFDGCPDWEGCELELLELADKYQVSRLKKLCEARVWQLSGERAVEVLLQTSRKLLLAPALHERLCRQVAWGIATQELQNSATLEALQTEAPYSAGMVDGIVRSGGPMMHLTYTFSQQN